ncbi:hypothetical protein R8Z50_22310 [Longispora sp. K20-0274]|uniref:hypothetical protein n=1 Tax=Longispora sp. K20-0274 TaxID=3088255 RepID=UPI00399C3420
MKIWTNLGMLVLAGGVGWLLWRAMSTARADRKRAQAEHTLRRRQHRAILLAGVGLAVGSVLYLLSGFDALPDLGSVASASAAPSTGPCAERGTGHLSLARTTPTTLVWTYTARDEAATTTTRLSVRVDGHSQGSVTEASGTVTVPDHPVALHIEGTGPGGRVYATCTG